MTTAGHARRGPNDWEETNCLVDEANRGSRVWPLTAPPQKATSPGQDLKTGANTAREWTRTTSWKLEENLEEHDNRNVGLPENWKMKKWRNEELKNWSAWALKTWRTWKLKNWGTRALKNDTPGKLEKSSENRMKNVELRIEVRWPRTWNRRHRNTTDSLYTWWIRHA